MMEKKEEWKILCNYIAVLLLFVVLEIISRDLPRIGR